MSYELVYLVISGAATAARTPEIARGIVDMGVRVICLPTPNADRVISGMELAAVPGNQVVESYFDVAIRPRPPYGVCLFAPCSFASLNKLAGGIADNLAISVVSEAIGRRTPVIVAPSLNQPLLDNPRARKSLDELASWGVRIIPPEDHGEGPRLAPTHRLLAAVREAIALPSVEA
jgi:phosphopantothenoylcysteine synthetase/decarboxylase